METPWLSEINRLYGKQWTADQVKKLGDGHIHQTFLIGKEGEEMVLQVFNHQVFRYPERITHNYEQVLAGMDFDNMSFVLPMPIRNQKGELFSFWEGQYFRIMPYVEGACINEVQDPFQAYLAGQAFAQFIVAGAKVNIRQLQESIPGFHDLLLRYQQLQEALSRTKRTISGELKEVLDFFLSQKPLLEEYECWKQKAPLRMTHNDTKINNLIFAGDFSKVNAVIDLDTIMAGYAFYDFGDLIRTVACTLGESSTDWEGITVDREKYISLWKGFTQAGKDFFSQEEILSLEFGGRMMTCIMGVRFLADYLNGNIYYHTSYEEQNLHRAKNQQQLLQSLQAAPNKEWLKNLMNGIE